MSFEVHHGFLRYSETFGKALTGLLTNESPVVLETQTNIGTPYNKTY